MVRLWLRLLMGCVVLALPSWALYAEKPDLTLTTVWQQASRGKASHINFRGDLEWSGQLGANPGQLLVHVRFGSGSGADEPAPLSPVNATVFTGNDPGVRASLAQFRYGIDFILDDANMHLELGKMNPFVFFDQVDIADDEASEFLNLSFVNNPMLDSGGGIGVYADGGAPGIYLDYAPTDSFWHVAGAVFGAGEGARFRKPWQRPLYIGQFTVRDLIAEGGQWQLLMWNNGQASNATGGGLGSHSGVGVAVNEPVSENVTLFGRYGTRISGRQTIRQALTVGGQLRAWGEDVVGIAIGLICGGADDDEQLAEVYYSLQLGQHVNISPNIQWFGGLPAASPEFIAGLRLRLDL
ncbi:MAG: hypothetical protein ACNYPG_05225 [Candidatus Porifericomitaceae bacterium WSBS_2022_MAG_OTU9]